VDGRRPSPDRNVLFADAADLAITLDDRDAADLTMEPYGAIG